MELNQNGLKIHTLFSTTTVVLYLAWRRTALTTFRASRTSRATAASCWTVKGSSYASKNTSNGSMNSPEVSSKGLGPACWVETLYGQRTDHEFLSPLIEEDPQKGPDSSTPLPTKGGFPLPARGCLMDRGPHSSFCTQEQQAAPLRTKISSLKKPCSQVPRLRRTSFRPR